MHSLEYQSEEIGVLLEHRLRRELKMLLLKLATDWILVTEDEVNLEMPCISVKRALEVSPCAPSFQDRSSRDRT